MVIMASKSFRMAQKLLSFVSLWDVRLGLLPGRGHSDISRNNLCPPQWPLKFRAQIQNKSASSNWQCQRWWLVGGKNPLFHDSCSETKLFNLISSLMYRRDEEEEEAFVRLFTHSRCLLCVLFIFLTHCLSMFYCFHSMPSRYVQINPGPGSLFTVPPQQPLDSWGRHRLRVPQRLLPRWCRSAGRALHQWVFHTLPASPVASLQVFTIAPASVSSPHVILPLCWRSTPKVLITWHAAAKLWHRPAVTRWRYNDASRSVAAS